MALLSIASAMPTLFVGAASTAGAARIRCDDTRSNIYVVRRGKGSSSLDTARMYCFRAPSMSEGLTVYGKDVYVA